MLSPIGSAGLASRQFSALVRHPRDAVVVSFKLFSEACVQQIYGWDSEAWLSAVRRKDVGFGSLCAGSRSRENGGFCCRMLVLNLDPKPQNCISSRANNACQRAISRGAKLFGSRRSAAA